MKGDGDSGNWMGGGGGGESFRGWKAGEGTMIQTFSTPHNNI